MEFLTASFQVIFEKIFDYTIGAVGHQIGYPIFYKKNVDNLRKKVKELENARDSVQRRVDVATRNVEKIENNVQMWLTDVEEIMAKARYQLSKRADKLRLKVKEINDRGEFSRIGYRERIQVIGTTIFTKGYEDFESRKSIFEGVMKALKDENIRAIGVYGMGGTGKTMLVEEVARQASEEKLFDEVVPIVVSQTPNLEKIQKESAKELGLIFKDEETDLEKAHLLHQRLNQGKKILIIIDDIWKKLDLEHLEARGISFEDDKKKCKILLTSRSRDVLDAQEIFPVGVLLDNEATYLFRKIVGDIVETSDFKSIVAEVIEECGGLPIAITTVAHALKSKKAQHDWRDALRELKMANPIEIDGVHEKVYASIKLSYNVLSKEAQSVFLFCSTFQEDVDIPIKFLWRLLVGLDFFQDVFTMEEVREQGVYIGRKTQSLLLVVRR
uniref:AAA+ ATPase domain-containing protein n=1 Tax=Fagus sylvatica TaxID=28930 RepID=A0A2N9I2F2_FAGSY